MNSEKPAMRLSPRRSLPQRGRPPQTRRRAPRPLKSIASNLLSWITWILPNRPISAEIAAVLSAGYLRGAELWHVACALYLDQEAREIPFLTLDDRQGSIARELGFPT